MRSAMRVLYVVGLVVLSGCGAGASNVTPTVGSGVGTGCALGDGKTVTMASEVKYEELQVCSGTPAKIGDTVTVNYVASVKDGESLRQIQSTYDARQAYAFKIGSGAPPGLDYGVVGMTLGGKRRLTLTPDLGFGGTGDPSKSVPANATLVYDVELMAIKP